MGIKINFKDEKASFYIPIDTNDGYADVPDVAFVEIDRSVAETILDAVMFIRGSRCYKSSLLYGFGYFNFTECEELRAECLKESDYRADTEIINVYGDGFANIVAHEKYTGTELFSDSFHGAAIAGKLLYPDECYVETETTEGIQVQIDPFTFECSFRDAVERKTHIVSLSAGYAIGEYKISFDDSLCKWFLQPDAEFYIKRIVGDKMVERYMQSKNSH